MTPKTHRKPHGFMAMMTGLAAALGIGASAEGNKARSNPVPSAGPSFYGGHSNGAPFVTHVSQKKCRKLNRRSGIHRKRRAKV